MFTSAMFAGRILEIEGPMVPTHFAIPAVEGNSPDRDTSLPAHIDAPFRTGRIDTARQQEPSRQSLLLPHRRQDI